MTQRTFADSTGMGNVSSTKIVDTPILQFAKISENLGSEEIMTKAVTQNVNPFTQMHAEIHKKN